MARVAALALAFVLTACATPYGKMGWRGGVDSLQLSDTVYRITARGNGFTSTQRVEDFILLKASEIAISRGYKGFVIQAEEDQSRVARFTTPGTSTTSTYGTVTGFGNGATVSGTSVTTYTPPVTHTIFKPGSAVIVSLVQEGGLNAQMIYSSLAPKYRAKLLSGSSVAPDRMGECQLPGENAAILLLRAECDRKGGSSVAPPD
jgi:hypothetical protein